MEQVVCSCRLPQDRRKSILGQRGGAHLYSPPVRACMPEDSTMRRSAVGLIVTLALGFLLAPLCADAQQPTKVYRIGRPSPGSPLLVAPLWEVFRQELRELGYVEGQNLVI